MKCSCPLRYFRRGPPFLVQDRLDRTCKYGRPIPVKPLQWPLPRYHTDFSGQLLLSFTSLSVQSEKDGHQDAGREVCEIGKWATFPR